MTEYKTVKLGDVCTITKGATGIMKAVPGQYPMVTLAESRTTHNEYQFDCAATIIPLVSSTGHGHASMKRVHFQEGKFALGSILCAVVPKDPNQLNPKFLHIYLSYFKDKLLVPLMHGAANVSLSISKIKNVEINLPPIDQQLKFIEHEKHLREKKSKLTTQIITQSGLILKMRQQILQDAISGELTSDWRNNNIGHLFAMTVPKETLNLAELPFNLPENWIWVKLGSICSKIGSGSTPRGSNYADSGLPFFRSQNIHDRGLEYSDIKYISNEVHSKMSGTKVHPSDVLLNITGGSLGRAALVPDDFHEGNVSQHVCIIRPDGVDSSYLHKIVLSPFFQKMIFDSTTGAGREGLPKYNLERFLVPVAPPEEQKEIIRKVNVLMDQCDQIEKNFLKSTKDINKMMQASLQDAFKK